MNGKETDVDCGGPESGCDPCAENKRCEHHSDCAGRLCLREYDPFPLPPCFVREVETARVFFPMEGNSTPTLVSTDITSLQWQVRGGPNCRVTLYDEFDKPEAVNPGDYIIGSTDAQAFPAKVTKVLVEMSHCAYLEERTGDACSNMSGCQWCVALNMCLDIRAVEAGECPVETWDSDLAPESSPYYVGYNPAEGQGSFGAEKGLLPRHLQQALASANGPGFIIRMRADRVYGRSLGRRCHQNFHCTGHGRECHCD